MSALGKILPGYHTKKVSAEFVRFGMKKPDANSRSSLPHRLDESLAGKPQVTYILPHRTQYILVQWFLWDSTRTSNLRDASGDGHRLDARKRHGV